MTQDTNNPPAGGTPGATDKAPGAAKELTAAQAAKRVRRPVVERQKVGVDADGSDVFRDVTRHVAVATDEVLSFKDYGTHVVVVTKDGQKFSSADAPKADGKGE